MLHCNNVGRLRKILACKVAIHLCDFYLHSSSVTLPLAKAKGVESSCASCHFIYIYNFLSLAEYAERIVSGHSHPEFPKMAILKFVGIGSTTVVLHTKDRLWPTQPRWPLSVKFLIVYSIFITNKIQNIIYSSKYLQTLQILLNR